MRVTCKLLVVNRKVSVEVIPSATALLIKALKVCELKTCSDALLTLWCAAGAPTRQEEGEGDPARWGHHIR